MKKYKILKLFNLLLLMTLVAGIGLNIYFTDLVGVAGYDLTEIEKEVLVEQKAQEELKSEYLNITSMNNIYAKALENGYLVTDFEFYSLPEFASR